MIQRITGLESEQYLDAAPEVQRERSLTAETEEFFFAQASNGHLQVFDKENGGMVFHLNKPSLFTQEELESFAEEYQNLDEDTVEAFVLKIARMMQG